MDPYDYDIDPVSPGLLKQKGGFPAFTEPSKVSSLSGGGGMAIDPVTASAIIQGGTSLLGSLFGSRGRRRQQEFENQLRKDQLKLQRDRFGLEQREYGDRLAQARAASQYANPFAKRFADQGGLAPSMNIDKSQYESMRPDMNKLGGGAFMDMFTGRQKSRRNQNGQ
jgi:hypothetical protein